VVVFELSLLVMVLGKLGWDIIVYRQSGRLPWVARHLCFWSVPGISSARYTQAGPIRSRIHTLSNRKATLLQECPRHILCQVHRLDQSEAAINIMNTYIVQ
jgi:hypothetical protein